MTRRSLLAVPLAMASQGKAVKALVFDVFGTVVDWRSTIISELKALNRSKRWHIDADRFADRWRAGYSPMMNRVRTDELPWTKLDALHRLILNDLVNEFQMSSLSEAEKDRLNRVWHRLKPWPDAVAGLTRLKQAYLIATLSNGNVSLLANMAKYAGLPWDAVLSAELFKHYKPDPECYLGAADLLDCKPAELMMVAAHRGDLEAARKAGLRTGFVHRPSEYGPSPAADQPHADTAREGEFDVVSRDFLDLATKLKGPATS